MSDFEREREVWNTLGGEDPLWAILSEDQQQNNTWNVNTFFERGRLDARVAMHLLEAFDLQVEHGAFLDFGCGVGRVSQHLCESFATGVGIDVSQPMIDMARDFNRFGERMHYHCNDHGDLSLLDDASFDFIYSGIVLQHIPQEEAKRYIREFVRVLRPSGVALFQIPSHEQPLPDSAHALPDEAFQAWIYSDLGYLRGVPGEPVALRLIIRNESSHTWPNLIDSDGDVFVRLGNHWLDPAGGLLLHDQARCQLMHSVTPRGEAHIGILVNLPEEPGDYVLEFDLVQEGIAWFAEHGSPTLQIPVTVKGGKKTSPGPNEHLPSCGMYPIRRQEVEATVLDAGGCVVVVANANCGGPTWADYWYAVRRAGA